jgi:hypothetical protein
MAGKSAALSARRAGSNTKRQFVGCWILGVELARYRRENRNIAGLEIHALKPGENL